MEGLKFRPPQLGAVGARMADMMRDVAQHVGRPVDATLVARINDTLRDWDEGAAAAVAVPTWRARIGAGEDFPMHVPSCVEHAMMGEIADLRDQVEPGQVAPRRDRQQHPDKKMG